MGQCQFIDNSSPRGSVIRVRVRTPRRGSVRVRTPSRGEWRISPGVFSVGVVSGRSCLQGGLSHRVGMDIEACRDESQRNSRFTGWLGVDKILTVTEGICAICRLRAALPVCHASSTILIRSNIFSNRDLDTKVEH